MTYILKNKNLELHIDDPNENYNFSRFDWTGKITQLKYKDIPFCTIERTDDVNQNLIGKGFYNEFGAKKVIGYEEIEIGDWFHKIGVGKLKKKYPKYKFDQTLELVPAEFNLKSEDNSISINCVSENIHGYAYVLKKKISLLENGFSIEYFLENTGQKDIVTDEYTHNFLAINKEEIGTNYILKFPFELHQEVFAKIVNIENKVQLIENEVRFSDSPKDQFFFRNLTGNENWASSWELINLKQKLGIKETTSFHGTKADLWGWKHVISPEIFYNISLKPNETTKWLRTYEVFEL